MSDKTNEEKLRILQERLSAIKQKETTRQQIRAEKNKPIAPVFEEELVSKKPNNGSLWKIIFFINDKSQGFLSFFGVSFLAVATSITTSLC